MKIVLCWGIQYVINVLFFSQTSTCPIVGIEGYCCPCSHTQWDTHSVGLPWTSDWPVTEASTYTSHTHKRETSMPPPELEPTFPAKERPQTYALDCEAAVNRMLLCCVTVWLCLVGLTVFIFIVRNIEHAFEYNSAIFSQTYSWPRLLQCVNCRWVGCATQMDIRNGYKVCGRNLQGHIWLGRHGHSLRTVLKLVINRMWTVLSWLRVWLNSRLLWIRLWTLTLYRQKFTWIMFKGLVCTVRYTHSIWVTKTNKLML
jgi:hypothetical protein